MWEFAQECGVRWDRLATLCFLHPFCFTTLSALLARLGTV